MTPYCKVLPTIFLISKIEKFFSSLIKNQVRIGNEWMNVIFK